MVGGDVEELKQAGEEGERGGERAGEVRVQDGEEEGSEPWEVPVPQ